MSHQTWLTSQGNDGERLNLQGRDLSQCYFPDREAYEYWNLSDAYLDRADFHDHNFKNVRLLQAKLTRSNLRGAQLSGCELCGADLSEADLCGASLESANIAGATLENVQIDSIAVVFSARNWLVARYDQNQLAQLGLPSNHNQCIEARNLDGYQLAGKDLSGCELKEFQLVEANLKGCPLSGAILSSTNLTRAMLEGASPFASS